MKSFIKKLYCGNIDPQNSGFEKDASVQRELRTISGNKDRLTDHLTGEEKKRFLDFTDAWSDGASTPPWTASSPASGWGQGLCWMLSCCRKLRRRIICKTKNKSAPALVFKAGADSLALLA